MQWYPAWFLSYAMSFYFIGENKQTNKKLASYELGVNLLLFWMLPTFESLPISIWEPLLGLRILNRDFSSGEVPLENWAGVVWTAEIVEWGLAWVRHLYFVTINVPIYSVNFCCIYTCKWNGSFSSLSASWTSCITLYQYPHLNLGYQSVYIHQSLKQMSVHSNFLVHRTSKNCPPPHFLFFKLRKASFK